MGGDCCATLRGNLGRGGRTSVIGKRAYVGGNACFIFTGVYAHKLKEDEKDQSVLGKKINAKTQVEA